MAMLPWCDGTIRYRVIAPSKMVFEENGGRITLLLSIVIMTGSSLFNNPAYFC